MSRPKRWIIADPHPAAADLAERLRTSPVLAQILLNRGLSDLEACRAFLNPSLRMLHEPGELAGLARAAERVAQAIRERQRIVIYGDYDVDGITATSILWHAIRLHGGQVDYYIPHRIDEGYGLNSEAVAQICEAGAQLIITVDCGITAIEQARIARERGVDLIITDHHEWREAAGSAQAPSEESGQVSADCPSLPDEPLNPDPSPSSNLEHQALKAPPLLPDCYAIVHPRLPREGAAPYPNPVLCGAGVAFKLAWGVGQVMAGGRVGQEFRDYLCEATALAALGTIADVVPLVGENRILAHYGLGLLKQSKLTGIRALIASAGLTGQKIDSYHVGFLLAPRLNACGRMGHAQLAVEMLTHADAARSQEIADYLETQNRARQSLEREILDQAIAQVQQLGMDSDDCRGFVLGGEGWHPGVIGIVASRIVERFGRPTVMVALNNGTGQGSARSIPGFHLSRAFEQCRDHLEAYGGHEMAAGCRLASGKFEDFRAAFRAHAGEVISLEMLNPQLHIECLAELRQITAPLVADLKRLGPFGNGNRKPLLACRDLEIAAPPRRVGKSGDHLQLLVRQGNSRLKCIAFNFAPLIDRLSPGTRVDLAVEPTLNEYNGNASVELNVKDVKILE